MEQEPELGGGSVQELSPTPWWRVALVGHRPRRTLVRIVVFVVACFLVRDFVLLPIRVEGVSMAPTYRDRRIDLVNRLAYLFHGPRRGDVVAIRLQAGGHVMYLKRVVGLPGETVAFHEGKLMINGRVMPEPYERGECDWELPPETLGLDSYYVVGDNRTMPAVDHAKGAVQRQMIVGKVLL